MAKRKSILDGVDEIIDKMLGIDPQWAGKPPRYANKTNCKRLIAPPHGFSGEALVWGIYDKVVSNYPNDIKRTPSPENWRFKPNPKRDPSNTSPEILRERAIVKTRNWANQTPTSSGLVDPYADSHRNIDLVHDCGQGEYEFVELKVKSNTPLFAAVEILQYGLLYAFARATPKIRDEAKDKPLLQASRIHLKVLAPPEYYHRFELAWLEDAINRGLHAFLKPSKFDFKMDFEFQKFPATGTVEGRSAVYK